MLIWDDAITIAQTDSSDSTSGSLTYLKLLMNQGYKFILAELGRPVTEKTQTAVTVASQQYYQLPPDLLFLKSVTITVGDAAYPVLEEESQEYWDLRNTSTQTSDIPQVFFLRPGFGVSGGEIGFYPKPSSADNTITLVYEATDKDLSQTKYTTGTVSLTTGVPTVTGSGTTFTTAMAGRYFQITDSSGDNLWYRISSVSGATSLTLENVYEGTTVSGVAYQIAESFALPEELQILPVYFALAHYFQGPKQNDKKSKDYWALFTANLKLGKERHGTKSRSSIIRPKGMGGPWKMWAPSFFPTSMS